MPSIFEVPQLAPLLVALRPKLEEATLDNAFKAQKKALAERHELEQRDAMAQGLSAYALEKARAIVKDILTTNPAVMVMGPPLLFAPMFPPPPPPVAMEIERLRGVLPAEARTAVDEAPISLDNKLVLAKAVEARLLPYKQDVENNGPGAVKGTLPWRALLQRQHGEVVDMEHRQKATYERLKARAQNKLAPQTPSPSKPLVFTIPASTTNTVAQQQRYFRFLVWNLENFTRDRRPRGSAPVDALRNQARIAAVADAAARFYVDAVLIMETGTDVGPATTALAKRLQAKCAAIQKDDRPWHPLTSPCTGSMPDVDDEYDLSIGRPSMTKALALRLLSEVYEVAPDMKKAPATVTNEQLAAGWQLLKLISPEFSAAIEKLPEIKPDTLVRTVKSGKAFPAPVLFALVAEKLAEAMELLRKTDPGELAEYEEELNWLHETCYYLVAEIDSGNAGFTADELVDAVEQAREVVDTIDDSDTGVEAWVEGLELLLLFALKAMGEGSNAVFQSSEEERCSLPLTAFLLTGAQHMRLEVLDPKLGPLQQDVDPDLVIDALVKLGLVERHVETYGIVYREPYKGALKELFDIGVREDALGAKFHGFSGGGLDEQAASYRIVKGQLTGDGFSIQEPGGLLNWRSALQITLPVAPRLVAPVVVYHTRYSGTAEIAKMDARFTAEENAVLARCESVRLMAQGVQPGAPSVGPPLVVGDFNLPNAYVNGEPAPAKKNKRALTAWGRKELIRTELLKNMLGLGYVRHAAKDDTCPRTTLKAFGSIALGEGYESQPYDGVYEPCGYVGALVEVASGILKPEGLVTPGLFTEEIEGHAAGGTDEDFDPDKDDDEGNEDDAPPSQPQDVTAFGGMVTEPPPPPKKKTTVAEAFGVEIGRVYRSFFRKFQRDLTELRPWLAKTKQPKVSARKSKYATKGASGALVKAIEQLENFKDDALAKLVNERVEWFIALVKKDAQGEYAKTVAKDPFAELESFLKQAAVVAKKELRDTSLGKLEEALARARKQAAKLEEDKAARYLIGYRAVVSDHLPQLVEIDTQPV